MKKLHTLTAILALTTAASAQNCKVADYPMDGTGVDTSGNGMTGTVFSAPTLTSDHNGQPNRAMNFDGVDDRIDLPSLFDYPQRTINLWFRADAILAANSGVLYNSDYNTLQNGSTILRAIDVGGPKLRYQVGGIWHEEPILAGQWYMATMVIDYDSVFCYLGCDLVGVFVQDYIFSATGDGNAKIACNRVNVNHLDGSIDKFAIYNCPLTTEEICLLTGSEEPAIGSMPSLSVFPNPTSGEVRVTCYEERGEKIELYDMYGRVVQSFVPRTSDFVLDVSHFPAGVYFVRIGESVAKLVKQ